MAKSKEAAYSLAERKYKRSEIEKAAENFRRWIGRDKSDEKNNNTGNATGCCRHVVASRSKKQEKGT